MKTWLVLACIEACSGLDADYVQVVPPTPDHGECVCRDFEKFYTSAYLDPYNDRDSGCYVYTEDPERNRNNY